MIKCTYLFIASGLAALVFVVVTVVMGRGAL